MGPDELAELDTPEFDAIDTLDGRLAPSTASSDEPRSQPDVWTRKPKWRPKPTGRTYKRVRWSRAETVRTCDVIKAAIWLRVPLPPTWVARVLAARCRVAACRGKRGLRCTDGDSVDRYVDIFHQDRWQKPTPDELREMEAGIRKCSADAALHRLGPHFKYLRDLWGA